MSCESIAASIERCEALKAKESASLEAYFVKWPDVRDTASGRLLVQTEEKRAARLDRLIAENRRMLGKVA